MSLTSLDAILGIVLVFALGLLVALPSALLLLAMHLWRHRTRLRLWLAHRRADRLLRRMREEGGA